MAAPHQMLDDRTLQNIFAQVDKDRSGHINATELQTALSNGTWKPFNPETVRLFINMFDRDGSGTIKYEEFKQLWQYVTDWLNCFRSFDKDNSGNIDKRELMAALTSFGYRLSDNFYTIAMRKFDRGSNGQVFFDDFIQLCITLQSLTAGFRHHDTDMDGVIQIKYEDFLSLVINACY